MSTTLRTLICSCQYLHEGDTGAALVLTHHVCTIPHTILPFQRGNRGGVSVSRRENGKEPGREDSEGRQARSCWGWTSRIFRNCRGLTPEDFSDLGFGTSLWWEQGQGCQGQPLDREAEAAVSGQAKPLALCLLPESSLPHLWNSPFPRWQGVCVRARAHVCSRVKPTMSN